jgi:hypothetical protein
MTSSPNPLHDQLRDLGRRFLQYVCCYAIENAPQSEKVRMALDVRKADRVACACWFHLP